MSINYYNGNEAIRNKVLRRFSMFDGTGTDLRGINSYEDALNEAGINYTAEKQPIYLEDGTIINNYFASVKSDEPTVTLGIVGEQYQPVDNKTAFSVCEELQNEGFNFEVGGPSLGARQTTNYAKSFLVMKGEDFKIEDDDYNSFAVLNNSFDGSTGVICRIIAQRVWCMNGAIRYLGGVESQLQINIQHSKTAFDKIEEAKKIMTKRILEIEAIKEEAKLFIGTKMTKEEFINKIIPLVLQKKRLVENNKDRERGQERIEMTVNQLMSAYNADDTQNYNNTAYKVILALQDFETHATPLRDTNNPHLYLNNIAKGMLLTTAVARYIADQKHLIVTK